jgi:hypothetical protein
MKSSRSLSQLSQLSQRTGARLTLGASASSGCIALAIALAGGVAACGFAGDRDDLGASSGALCRDDGGCIVADAGGSAGAASSGDGSPCQSDADCGGELECEIEHGAGYCKPHGGSAGSGGSDDASAGSGGSDDASAGSGNADCTCDADCGAGLECEDEHDAGYCKPHGGDSEPSGERACEEDTDCAAGERCESIGQGQRRCFAEGEDGRSGSNSGRY